MDRKSKPKKKSKSKSVAAASTTAAASAGAAASEPCASARSVFRSAYGRQEVATSLKLALPADLIEIVSNYFIPIELIVWDEHDLAVRVLSTGIGTKPLNKTEAAAAAAAAAATGKARGNDILISADDIRRRTTSNGEITAIHAVDGVLYICWNKPLISAYSLIEPKGWTKNLPLSPNSVSNAAHSVCYVPAARCFIRTGGYAHDGRRVERYSLDTRRWSDCLELPKNAARRSHVSIALGTRVFLCCGSSLFAREVANSVSYSLSRNRYTTIPSCSLYANRTDPGVCFWCPPFAVLDSTSYQALHPDTPLTYINGKPVPTGAGDGATTPNHISMVVPDMDYSESGGCGAIGMLITGGHGGSGPIKDCQLYSLRDGKWYFFPPLKHARYGHAMAVVDDTVFVFGGQMTRDGAYSNLPTERFDENRFEWVDYTYPIDCDRTLLTCI